MEYELKFSRYNEHSILIEWPAIMDENMLKDILNFKNIIEKKYIKEYKPKTKSEDKTKEKKKE